MSKLSDRGEAPGIKGESSGTPLLDVSLRALDQFLVAPLILVLGHAEARLVVHVRREISLGHRGVELEGALAIHRAPRVVPVERPVTGLDGELLLLESAGQVIAVRDALAVGDDQRCSRERVRFLDGLERLRVLGAEGDARDVDVAVAHGQHAQVLLRARLAGDCELRRGAHRRRLRGLAAGIRVDLGVDDEDIHLAPEREHMVEAAVADVVRPAVAADDPDALLDEIVGEQREPLGLPSADRREQLLQLRDARPLRGDARLGGLVRVKQIRKELRRERDALQELARLLLVLVRRQPEAEAEFGIVLEE
jgi:hypothetical protein